MIFTKIWHSKTGDYAFLSNDPRYHWQGNPYFIQPEDSEMIYLVEAYLLDHPDALQPEPLPPPPTDEQLRDAEISSLKAYLAGTDWYVARYAETGTAIPDDVKAARAAARERIDELRGQA